MSSVHSRTRVGFLGRACGPSQFERLVQDSSAELYLSADLYPRDPSTGSVRRFLATDAPRLHTLPTDDPPVQHLARIFGGWSIARRLTEQGRFIGASSVAVGNLSFDNLDGLLTFWQDLDWSDAVVMLRLGGRLTADGRGPYPWKQFYLWWTGTAEELEPGPDSSLVLRLAGRAKSLQSAYDLEPYRGFGGAVELVSPTGLISGGIGVDLALGTACTIEWFGVIDALPAGVAPLLHRGTFGLQVDLFGRLIGSTTLGSSFVTSYTVPVGEPIVIACSIDGANHNVRLMAGSNSTTLQVVGEGFVAAIFDAGTFNAITAGNGAGLTVWEARIWRGASSLEEVAARAGAPITDALNRDTLAEAWKFDDAEGILARGEKGAIDLDLSGSANWVSSLDGDDPEAFPGGSIGTYRTRGFGLCRSIQPVLVDTPRANYSFGQPGAGDVQRAYLNGAPMVPEQTLGPGVCTFDATEQSITLPAGVSAAHLIPGQVFPERAGQHIDVSGTSLNDGTFTIAQNGISADGRTIKTVDTIKAEVSSATIISTPADVQYSYDLVRSIVTPTSVPAGNLTVDAILWRSAAGTAKASEVFAFILGQQVDTSDLIWDPEIGLFLEAGSPRSTALDKIAASAFAWWIEDGRNGYRFGTWRLPKGDPKTRIDASRIDTIVPVPTIAPYRRIKCAYDRTVSQLDSGSIAGSVPASERERMSKPWGVAQRMAPTRTLDAFRLAVDREEPFETWLASAGDAERWLDLATPFFLEKRYWYEVRVSGIGILDGELWDEVWLQHPDPTCRLADGATALILSAQRDAATDQVVLEAFR
jgi:hypothetical protein